jgi:4-amino-4-deoxy-L-arabinose transferase-like glycosyltransferase
VNASSTHITVGATRRKPRVLTARETGFWPYLSAIVLAAVVIRVLYTILIAPWPPKFLTDEFYYNVVPHAIDQGRGFALPFGIHGLSTVTAEHPPLYPLVLAGLGKLGGTDQLAQRLTGSLFGAGTIICVAVLARRLRGDRAGLLAAGIAAIYPNLIAADGALMSESLYGLLIALSLLAAYRLLASPKIDRGLVLGALVGLAALTRAEAVLLLPLLLVPVVRRRHGTRVAAVACLALLAVITPWTVRNAIVFHHFVPLATDSGSAIAGANCHSVYYGPDTGYWNIACVKDYRGNEAATTGKMRSDGARYALHHVTRLPVVIAVRELRVWGLYQPMQQHSEGRAVWVEHLGVAAYFVLVAWALYAIPVLRRLRESLWILMSPFILVAISAAVVFGAVRFRQPAELSLVIVAAFGAERLLTRLIGRPDPPPPPPRSELSSAGS